MVIGYTPLNISSNTGVFIQSAFAPDNTSYAFAFTMLAQFCNVVSSLSVAHAVFITKAIMILTLLLPGSTSSSTVPHQPY